MSALADLIMNAQTLEWLRDSACEDMDPDDFFVVAGHTIDPAALNVCRRCPVREECLRYVYERNHTAGYFGGISPGARRNMTLEQALEFIENDPPQPVVLSSRRRG